MNMSQFQHELSQLYFDLGGSTIPANDEDLSFNSKTLDLLKAHPIEMDSLLRYTQTRKAIVSKAIRKSSIAGYRNPVIILLFYYVEYFDESMAYEWPFSDELFKEFRSYLGLAKSYFFS